MKWSDVFDSLTSEYGWNTEYILTRTMREIDWRIRAINKRVNQDIDFQLTIRGLRRSDGKKLDKTKRRDLSDSEQEALKIALEKAKQRKAQEYGRKISN